MQKTEYFVDSDWLARQLGNPQVVIVDCRFQLADPNWGEFKYGRASIKSGISGKVMP